MGIDVKKAIEVEPKDVIILTCKVNVGGMDDADVPEFIEQFGEFFKSSGEGTNLITYMFPTRVDDTEVKILTPKLTTKKKTIEIEKQLENIVNNAKNKLDNLK